MITELHGNEATQEQTHGASLTHPRFEEAVVFNSWVLQTLRQKYEEESLEAIKSMQKSWNGSDIRK